MRLAGRRAAAVALAHGASSAPCAPCALSENPDARFFREQHEHRLRGLTLVDEARGQWWHEVTRRMRDGEGVNTADAQGVTVLHLAAKHGKRRLVEELLMRGATPTADASGRGPLGWAAAGGHASVAATLLELGASDVNEADQHGTSALHVAAQQGHLGLARTLLSRHDLQPQAADMYGVAPLHKAVSFGHASLVAALVGDSRVAVDQRVGDVRVPASFDAKSGNETPLGLAAGHTYHFNHTHHTRIAVLLLDAGADPNLCCGAGMTAAHRAADAGNTGIVRELLARGDRVDWEARDARGRTAEELARMAGHPHIAKLISARREAGRGRA